MKIFDFTDRLKYKEDYKERQKGVTIDAIIIHHTGGGSVSGALEHWLRPDVTASAHYIVDFSGNVYYVVKDDMQAYHAGESELNGRRWVNQFSLGIELLGDGNVKPFTKEQMDTLVELCCSLCSRYNIKVSGIVGHSDVAVPKGRKVDPGKHFPWSSFRERLMERGIVWE